jgi:D-glycero-D-manno-heptose 1,7-bisphosphate phosphatase
MVKVGGVGPAVFLDRDGVLVIPEFRDGRSYAPRSMDAFSIYEDAKPCLARLKAAGFILVVVTNQPDVGAGFLSSRELETMHETLRAGLPIDHVEVCIHTQNQQCDCRKPKPGMLMRAAELYDIDLASSFMVGDRASDVAAGRAAGCRTAFLDLSYEAEAPPTEVDFRAGSLPAITDWIILQHFSMETTS